MTKIGEWAIAIGDKIKLLNASVAALNTAVQTSLEQVARLKDELTERKKRQESLEAELAKTRQQLAALQMDGDFSVPMTKSEMAGVLNLKPRAFNTFAKSHGLRRCGRQLFQIRLNAMDRKTRKLFE
jgi:hypothetical protein